MKRLANAVIRLGASILELCCPGKYLVAVIDLEPFEEMIENHHCGTQIIRLGKESKKLWVN